MELAGREDDKFLVRLPGGLRERIKTKAKENLRSMNSEIIFLCLQSHGSAAPEAADLFDLANSSPGESVVSPHCDLEIGDLVPNGGTS